MQAVLEAGGLIQAKQPESSTPKKTDNKHVMYRAADVFCRIHREGLRERAVEIRAKSHQWSSKPLSNLVKHLGWFEFKALSVVEKEPYLLDVATPSKRIRSAQGRFQHQPDPLDDDLPLASLLPPERPREKRAVLTQNTYAAVGKAILNSAALVLQDKKKATRPADVAVLRLALNSCKDAA